MNLQLQACLAHIPHPKTTHAQLLSPYLSSRTAHSMRVRPRLQPVRAAFRGTAIRHRSSISGPYLLDEYIPRYQLLTSVQEAKKRSLAYAHLRECNLCPRLCSVNRFEKRGTCLIGSDVVVNTIAPHFAEEPCISGRNGSGSVFFSGCNLRCND